MSVMHALILASEAYATAMGQADPRSSTGRKPGNDLVAMTIRPEEYVVLLEELKFASNKIPESVRVREIRVMPSDYAACIRAEAPWCPQCRHPAHANRIACSAPKGAEVCPCTCRITADRHGFLERSSDGHCITFGGTTVPVPGNQPQPRPSYSVDGGKPMQALKDGPVAGPMVAAR
jgi:hypothetical protein